MIAAVAFEPRSLILLNLILALMMFGVSLSLRLEDFERVVLSPIAPIAGLFAQFFLLPLATCLFTWALNIDPELALGMILVASCPGGSFSNIMTWLARGNVAVSVSMTAVSSLAAAILTPVNFAFYGWLNPYTREYLTKITIEPSSILILVLLVLALPLVLGMVTGRSLPDLVVRIQKPLRIFSLLVLMAFVAIAFSSNFALFLERFHSFFGWSLAIIYWRFR
ncbi:bile acid:sodium symporter family protein [Psychrobacter sp. ER1]|uniref:bile acid:sodium symporter family protein n=1 Tax=Psychrobacter sp. ER1 TaxID=3406645 RepID=UPI003B42A219